MLRTCNVLNPPPCTRIAVVGTANVRTITLILLLLHIIEIYILYFINLQKLLTSLISLIFWQLVSNNFGLNKITATHCALEIATFNLFLLKKKSLCLGKLSTSEVVIDINTTLASWPWNKSIVPTLTSSLYFYWDVEIKK